MAPARGRCSTTSTARPALPASDTREGHLPDDLVRLQAKLMTCLQTPSMHAGPCPPVSNRRNEMGKRAEYFRKILRLNEQYPFMVSAACAGPWLVCCCAGLLHCYTSRNAQECSINNVSRLALSVRWKRWMSALPKSPTVCPGATYVASSLPPQTSSADWRAQPAQGEAYAPPYKRLATCWEAMLASRCCVRVLQCP